MKKVLFVCIHNSARSQMAETYLNELGEGRFHAESAGIEPGKLNPFVVKAMMDDGIDISQNTTKSVQEMIDQKKEFDYVVTVCDETSAERCPHYPGKVNRLHCGFEDPSALDGTDEEKLKRTIQIRDQIKQQVRQWVNEL